MLNLVTRLEAPGKLTLEQYRKLPVGAEIVVWDRAPIEFMDKDIWLTIARERQYKIRRVPRHWVHEYMRTK